jgi:hypothetical protein
MKILTVIALAFIALSTTNASATEYKVFVTQQTHISQGQSELGSLVQKDIIIDTDAKTVTLHLSPVCAAGSLCPEFIRIESLPLTKIESKNGRVSSITARSTTRVNKVENTNSLKITLNPNNATDIVITDTTGKVSAESTFVGSPATVLSAQ